MQAIVTFFRVGTDLRGHIGREVWSYADERELRIIKADAEGTRGLQITNVEPFAIRERIGPEGYPRHAAYVRG